MIKRIFILTLFPEYFEPLLKCGISGQAFRGARSTDEFKFDVSFVNIRDFSTTKYKSVDDSPYGGGPGMVMRVDILRDALMKGVVEAHGYNSVEDLHVVYTSPRGTVWNNKVAREFATGPMSGDKDLVFICGRYEGIDERFIEKYVNQIFSIGDFVLTGGEIAVLTILDSAVRFVPGILGNKFSSSEDSFETGMIEYPQYTRPAEFEGMPVPEVLMNGDHKLIHEWQRDQQLALTKKYRPDLIKT